MSLGYIRPPNVKQIEKELMEKLRQAERDYQAAAQQHRAIALKTSDSAESKTGGLSREEAGRIEAEALANYSRLLKEFSDLVLRGVVPQ